MFTFVVIVVFLIVIAIVFASSSTTINQSSQPITHIVTPTMGTMQKCGVCNVLLANGSDWCRRCERTLPPSLIVEAGLGARKKPAAFADDEGIVYLLKGEKYYKIGKTNDISRRFNELKILLPFDVDVVHVIHAQNMSSAEIFWHKKFADKRTKGEWFLLTESDVAEFKKQSQM